MPARFPPRRELKSGLGDWLTASFFVEGDADCAVAVRVPTFRAQSLSRPDLVIRTVLVCKVMKSAPVVALAFEIGDDPEWPFRADAHLDVDLRSGRKILEKLGAQTTLPFFLVDFELRPVVVKAIPWDEPHRVEARAVRRRALGALRELPRERYDFPRAWAAFIRAYWPALLLGSPSGEE